LIYTLTEPAPEIDLAAPIGMTLPTPETVWFQALDGHWLNFKHLPPVRSVIDGGVDRGPVILVHGAGVRANLFCPPTAMTLPAMLAAEGFDVWMLNWRSSIDLRPIEWNLDDAAVLDYPAAVQVIRQFTGHDSLKAVIHCQGSCSFLMALVSGNLGSFTTVVSNSSALHPLVPLRARLKLPLAVETFGRMTDWFNPQYGLHPPRLVPKIMNWMVRTFHHECNNAVCKYASFVYGVGFPTMWRHENLNDETHEWLKGEFAHVPAKLFKQMRRCVAKGRLVSMGSYQQGDLPREFALDEPDSEATFHFITGAENRCFKPRAIEVTKDFLNRFDPAQRHTAQRFAGYGHMDVFIGKNASNDVFPYIVAKLCG
jgi:pimeloyl-ACP methyl ester carboxylesterase